MATPGRGSRPSVIVIHTSVQPVASFASDAGEERRFTPLAHCEEFTLKVGSLGISSNSEGRKGWCEDC